MFLLRLVESEIMDRERRATERRIKAAKFPVSKSLETYNFLDIPSLNKNVKPGDNIVIFCTGLGEVDPPVPSGTPAPTAPPSKTVNSATLTIGGVAASVVFSGLAPGSAGVYQVTAVMPDGVLAGDQIPVLLTVAGQQSQPVTIAVR